MLSYRLHDLALSNDTEKPLSQDRESLNERYKTFEDSKFIYF